MAKYISAEIAKKALADSALIPRYAENCKPITDRIIDSLPAADVEPVRRWIPCSESLPNDFEDVLCWYEYFRFGSYNRMFRKCGVGYQVNGHWGGEVSTGRNAKVLAWMPLPEPPKMEGDTKNG